MQARKNAESPKPAPIVLFDGECNLCNGTINFIIDHDPGAYFTFGALQADEASPYLEKYCDRGDEEALKSVVLIEGGVCYTRSTAVLRIMRNLRGGWPAFYYLLAVPAPLRNVIYDFISKYRYQWFGKRDSCRRPTPELQGRFLKPKELKRE